jgi:sugar O-acyltransferase (sialic acid O-acetyltransferase NeuD family)
MPIDRLTLIGTGGHAKVVLDALRAGQAGPLDVQLVDENPARVGALLWDEPIGLFETAGIEGRAFHVCIGANAVRARIFVLARTAGARPRSVVHPHGSQARGADWGDGSLLAAGVRLGPDTRIGEGCIVNHNAVVDHDCVVGDFCHIAPGATLAGNVRLGHGVLVGAGANILPGIRIGDGATIGAGAVVLEDVPPQCLYAGVPARKIKK